MDNNTPLKKNTMSLPDSEFIMTASEKENVAKLDSFLTMIDMYLPGTLIFCVHSVYKDVVNIYIKKEMLPFIESLFGKDAQTVVGMVFEKCGNKEVLDYDLKMCSAKHLNHIKRWFSGRPKHSYAMLMGKCVGGIYRASFKFSNMSVKSYQLIEESEYTYIDDIQPIFMPGDQFPKRMRSIPK